MLNVFREGARSWGIKLFIWLVAFTFVGSAFVFWGQGLSTGEDAVVIVGSTKISRREYLERVRRLEDMFRSQMQGRMNQDLLKSLNIPNLAVNSLVESALQISAATEVGIVVSDLELRATIESMKEFHTAGSFDSKRYVETLGRNSLTTGAFEESMRADLFVAKLRAMVEQSVYVSETEAKNQYLYENGLMVVDYVKVGAENLKSKVKTPDKEVEAWFETRKHEFIVPEKRSFRMLKVATKTFEENITLSREDLEKYFNENISRFETSERVHARHVLIQLLSSAPAAEVKKAKEKIDKARMRVMGAESFGKVAKEMSDGPSASNGGDLGKFKRGDMVAEFEKVVFDMKTGEVSEPFRTEFGFHIVKKLEHIKRKVPTFDEAKDRVDKIVRKLNSRSEAGGYMEKLKAGLKPENFASASDTGKNVKINSYSVSKGLPAPGLAGLPMVEEMVFTLDPREISSVINMPDGYGIVMVDSIDPTHTPPLEKIKKKVLERFRFAIAMEMAEVISLKIQKSVGEGNKIKSAAKGEGLTVKKTKPFSRTTMRGSPESKSEAMVMEAFELENGEAAISPVPDGYLVLAVASRPAIDEKEMTGKIADLREGMLQRKRSQIYSGYLANLRKKAEDRGEVKVKADLVPSL